MDIRRKPPNPRVRVENLEYSIPHKDSQANNILEEIVWHKDIEIKNFKESISLKDLIKQIDGLSPTKGFLKRLRKDDSNLAIIAEIKKASPSKGVIRDQFHPQEIASVYEESGAACISVLTDRKFFKGGYEVLSKVRDVTDLPILCKDFIISPYQVYKARIAGADAILLIAAILKDNDLIYLKRIADKLKLDVLVEVHNSKELDRVLNLNCFNLLGINNRNLKTFKTDLKTTLNLMEKYSSLLLKENIFCISESGINSKDDIDTLKSIGVKGALIGETFMKQSNINKAFKELLDNV